MKFFVQKLTHQPACNNPDFHFWKGREGKYELPKEIIKAYEAGDEAATEQIKELVIAKLGETGTFRVGLAPLREGVPRNQNKFILLRQFEITASDVSRLDERYISHNIQGVSED